MSADTYHWDQDTDVIYSPDDDGYYAQCFRSTRNRGTSQVFTTFQDALRALSEGAIEWNQQ